MEVHVDNPDLEKKIAELAAQTGRNPDELVRDVLTSYFETLADVRGILDARYDELKSGRVKPL